MINVNTPLFSGNEKEYLINCIESGYVSSFGNYVDKFETKFSEYLGVKYSTSVSNGTVALDLAFEALELKAGDEVILPSGTIISCLLPILRRKLKPIFVDSDSTTWNVSVENILEKITDKTKAILVVHLYGLYCDVKELRNLISGTSIKIIEDCAEGLGGQIDNEKLGSIGDISTFSFYANKLITTGEGGMVSSNSQELIEKVKYYKNLCFQKPRFYHENLGWNSRFTNVQAAIGLAQLENIDSHLNRKKQIGKIYNELFKNKSLPLEFPLPSINRNENVYWVYGLINMNPKLKLESAIDSLISKGIETRPFFYPLHKQPFINQQRLNLPNCEFLGTNGFYIPSGLGVTQEEQEYIAKCVIQEFEG